jgi:hypothetical protein
MRLRILCTVGCVCFYVKLFRGAFYKTSYKYAKMIIHGMLYLEGQVNCRRLCEYWQEDVHHQRLVHFLNHGHMNMNLLNTRRIEQVLPLAIAHKENRCDRLQDYLLFSIDPSDFKKYKNKRMQGVHYTRDATGSSKAQTFVMSSFIYGHSCVPFKKILYWGKKGVPTGRQVSKNRIYLKLATKAEQVDSAGKTRLGLFDGAGCNRTVLPYFHKSPDWAGFVCKFPRIRNIELDTGIIHIRKYLAQLTQEDFQETEIAGTTVWSHSLTAKVPSLSFLGTIRLVVIQDEPGNLNQKTFRVLITDVMALSVDQILLIYLRRWKQETYHQIIKDRLGARSYKHRKLKAIMRFLELADVAYCFLEYRRLKARDWQESLSEVRNELIRDFEKDIALKYNLTPPKHAQKAA